MPKKIEGDKPQVFREWCDINKASGREYPAPTGPDTRASKSLGNIVPNADIRRCVMKLFLEDDDDFLVKQGHPLRMLLGRINAYLNPGIKPRSAKTQDDLIEEWLDAEHKTAKANGYGMTGETKEDEDE